MFDYYIFLSNLHPWNHVFAAHDMARLASDIYQCKAEVLKGNLFENRHILLSHLLQGHPVLVPYDNDKNFEPCLQNGHRAHWAVITGDN